MRRELEGKTGATLPDINRPSDISNPRNVLEGKRVFGNQQQYKTNVKDLTTDNEARYVETSSSCLYASILTSFKDSLFKAQAAQAMY
jgi:hypothetical protein